MLADASFAVALAAASPAVAGCACLCQDGQNRPVCDAPAAIRPVCAPRACATGQPVIRSLPSRRIRPLGQAQCALTRVYDEASGNFEWVRLCN